MRRPGQVTTDAQAFRQIRARLQNEPGALIRLVEESKKAGGFRNTAPFWAFVRMLFPIANRSAIYSTEVIVPL